MNPTAATQSWIDQADARDAVYGNRRRIRGDRGKRLLRRRGERVERSFAHTYDTGGMRRTHLRGTANILKRVLVHASGFNLGLVMRRLIGVATPRGLQGRVAAFLLGLISLKNTIATVVERLWMSRRDIYRRPDRIDVSAPPFVRSCEIGTFTTGC